MFIPQIVALALLVSSGSEFTYAILNSGPPTQETNRTIEPSEIATTVVHNHHHHQQTQSSDSTDSGGGGSSSQPLMPTGASSVDSTQHKTTDSNTTFYYEANAFLLNNKNISGSTKDKINLDDDDHRQGQQQDNEWAPKKKSLQQNSMAAASIAMTSARNGRMMDLDALVGDFAASQANRERSQTGNRQSRYLNTIGHHSHQPSIDVGGGKKLHIQGFIPIVGVKDATAADDDEMNGSSGNTDNNYQEADQMMMTAAKQKRAQGNELPYGQSSIGHASFGIQRFLSGGNESPSPQQSQIINWGSSNNQQQQQQQQYQQQVTDSAPAATGKFSGGASSVVESLRKPIIKLANYAKGESHQQNCLCVPFYMCKNGYISESSLGKSQIQQMILQQQQQQADLKSGGDGGQFIATAPRAVANIHTIDSQQQQQQQHAQYADSYAPVDERSLDKDIITMAPLIDFSSTNAAAEANANQTTSDYTISGNGELGGGSSDQAINQAPSQSSSSSSSSTSSSSSDEQQSVAGNSTDYSQEILGRMLGLKSSTSRLSSSSSTGVCGLLRTCCNIPVHLFPSQQDMANERLVAQFGNQQSAGLKQQVLPANTQKVLVNRQIQTIYGASQQNSDLIPQPQTTVIQRYQPQLQMTQSGSAFSNQYHNQQQRQQQSALPYGFPAITSQISRMQPLNTFNPSSGGNFLETSLAHRSTQFQQQQQAGSTQLIPSGNINNRHQQQQQVSQYTRVSPQQLQSFQQQQQQAKAISGAIPLGLTAAAAATMSSGLVSSSRSQNPQSLGTRKILDGRCGLRQSAGITGRVQNLQYPESSADFGEYPAQVAILKRLSGSDSLFVCGGTLISQYWIATAAHCIKKHSQSDLKVRLGEWDVHRDDEFYPFVEKEVRDLVVHPEFIAGNLVNDIALLRLDSPIDPSLPHVNPACLPTIDESFTRQRCWVTGWGKDSFGQKGSFQAVLKEVELPVVGQGECESALRQTRLGPHYRLHSGFICAGGEGGRDACEGDGGSGLYCIQPDGIIKVAGLVSWGIGCGQAGVPGVYVNLAHYRPWIENIISIDEDIYSPYANMMMIGANSLISERSNGNTTTTTNNSNSSSSSNVVDEDNQKRMLMISPSAPSS